MKKGRYLLRHFVYEAGTQTIRCKPQNYWITTVINGRVVFNSWDAAINGRYSKLYIRLLWKFSGMQTTELKHWCNGIQVRGKDFYSLAWSVKKMGFLFCFSFSLRYISFNLFKLI